MFVTFFICPSFTKTGTSARQFFHSYILTERGGSSLSLSEYSQNPERKFYRGNMKKFRGEISEISDFKIVLFICFSQLPLDAAKGLLCMCAIVIAI